MVKAGIQDRHVVAGIFGRAVQRAIGVDRRLDALGDHPHAAGPFGPVTIPPISSLSIAGTAVACALAGNGLPTIALARTATAIAAKLVRNNSLVVVIVSFPE